MVTLYACILIFNLDYFKDEKGKLTVLFYCAFTFYSIMYTLIRTTMFLSVVSFYAKIADRKIGGTYMTLLNTITNLGTIYPSTFGMYLINLFNVKKCINVNQFDNNSSNFTSVYQKTNGTVNLFENQCSGGKESLVSNFLIL